MELYDLSKNWIGYFQTDPKGRFKFKCSDCPSSYKNYLAKSRVESVSKTIGRKRGSFRHHQPKKIKGKKSQITFKLILQ